MSEKCWSGPYGDMQIPDLDLFSYVFADIADDDDGVAVVDHATGDRLTFGEVKSQAIAFAAWLLAHGIGQGSVVALFLPNCPQYLPVFHGVVRSGAAAALINHSYTAEEAADLMRLAKTRLLVAHETESQVAIEAARLAGIDPKQVVLVGGATGGGTFFWDDICQVPGPAPRISLDPSRTVACIPFSSGTSGKPKPVMLSHRNLVANMVMFMRYLDFAGRPRPVLAVLPYSHVFSLNGCLNSALQARSTQITFSSFDPMAMVKAIECHKPRILLIVPTIAAFLAKHPAVAQMQNCSVALIICGSASLDPEFSVAVAERLGARFIQGFGMTELSTCTHLIPPERTDMDPASVGQALPNLRFRVVNPGTAEDVDISDAGVSEPGELWCTGPNVMMGYADAAAETNEVLDSDGWIHTGDLVTVDAEGVVRVVGRLKELIKRHGLQIAPVELEHILCQHPEVADAAVVGVAAPGSSDQVPYALIQRCAGATVEADELMRFIAERVAPYKRLGGVRFIDHIPRSAAGKIVRRDLKSKVQL
ncbi:AMP-binding protein [uncultured Actinomyces sp.]|uniref:AMP-binding protein n=1 Tax=uncultured Actinomyces sp. TaxID=249061 RepID=UPI002618A4F6|nr:AMP-binding protein [uncultured Actinomyces sp.]